VRRQLSAPVSSSPPHNLARGETSPLAQRILTRDWASHADIEKSDLEPQLYKKEALMQKFQTSNRKNTCGTLDTEVSYDADSLELKVCYYCLLFSVILLLLLLLVVFPLLWLLLKLCF
jgi:hypothetical protein